MSEAAVYIAEALHWFYLALANLLGKLNMTSFNIVTHMQMTLDIGLNLRPGSKRKYSADFEEHIDVVIKSREVSKSLDFLAQSKRLKQTSFIANTGHPNSDLCTSMVDDTSDYQDGMNKMSFQVPVGPVHANQYLQVQPSPGTRPYRSVPVSI
ncbi:hypothetical protein MUK42_01991 [Musa troglodytarum]|uniref:Uncharacterized protein n=1 Tax=Musa troglodytarum TaxID=320322 RepID=A0A9E7ENF3_9LILI|nr:hypothetical protein MUK42_01991 [Musa troglodytarum]